MEAKALTKKKTIQVPATRTSNSQEPIVRTLHLDTSVQVERVKAARKSDPVEKAIAEFRFLATSTYARFEFKKTWLYALGVLHELSRSAARVEEIVGLLDDRFGKNTFQHRKLSTALQAAEKALSKVPDKMPYGLVVARLRAHLRQWLLGAYDAWTRSVTHEYDGTECVRAKDPPRRGPKDTITVMGRACRKGKTGCKIADFFEANKAAFLQIADAIQKAGDAASPELKKSRTVILAAARNPTSLCSTKECQKIGDAIIAIDGLPMECFAANNPRDWPLIASALGKRLINPVPKG